MENLKGKKLVLEILSEIPYDVNLRPKNQVTLPEKLIKKVGLENAENYAMLPVRVGRGGGDYEGVIGFLYYPIEVKPSKPKNDNTPDI